MKKLLYTLTLALIFLSSVSPVFAWSGSCKTITINATDKAISVVVSGCAAFSTADKDHVYRVMASEKDFAATKASSDPYTYEIKEATKDESFSKQLAASKDEYHSGTGGYGGVGGSAGFSTTHTFKYVSIIEFANSTDTDPAKGSLVKEQKIIAPVTFRDLIVTSENADGYTTVDGGIKTNGDIGPYKTKIRLATSTDPAFPPGKTDYYTKGFSLKDDGTFSFVANDLYTKRNPGETMYLKQFYYDPITGEAVWDSKYSSANKIFGNDIAAQTDDLEKHSYTLLSSLAQDKPTIFYDPGSKSCDVAESSLCDFSSVLNFVIKLMIGAAVVFLIISLMIDGFKYMLTDIAGVKSEAKKTIMDKGLGLLIALSSYVILRTINPTLVDNTLSIDQVTITKLADLGIDTRPKSGSAGSGKGGTGYDFSKLVLPAGVQCPGKTGGKGDIRTVALSFLNHVTYNQDLRGTSAPGGHVYLDCSSYVNTVLKCAGITPKTEAYTGDMSAAGTAINTAEVKNGKGYVNGSELKPGDLVGVRTGGEGHVWIYIGNGEIIDSQVSGYQLGRSVIKTKTLQKSIYPKMDPLNFVTRL